MNDFSSGNDNGPPGQNLLAICLAMLAAVLGTPYLFELVGPFIQKLVYQAYDSEALADLMYYASFALSGIAIFTVTRMALWYAIAAIVAFGAMRMSGAMVAL